jgi:hypothetical protein
MAEQVCGEETQTGWNQRENDIFNFNFNYQGLSVSKSRSQNNKKNKASNKQKMNIAFTPEWYGNLLKRDLWGIVKTERSVPTVIRKIKGLYPDATTKKVLGLLDDADMLRKHRIENFVIRIVSLSQPNVLVKTLEKGRGKNLKKICILLDRTL